MRLKALLNDGVRQLESRRLETSGAFSPWKPGTKPWCLFGSAVMQLHLLRDDISDVDVAVNYRLFEMLANTVACRFEMPRRDHPPLLVFRDGGADCHIFYDWRHDEPAIDLDDCRRTSHIVNGWPCTPLREIRAHKQASIDYCWVRYGYVPPRWQKHVHDRDAIDRYLEPRPITG